MDKLLIFGGTFNPIHNGHLHLAAAFEKVVGAQRVILMPTRIPPHKKAADLAPLEDRLTMCRLAVREKHWLVSDLEMRRCTPSYTADTLEELTKRYPQAQLYFLMGEDMFLTLFSWHDPDRILRLATVCAAPRSISGFGRMAAFAEKIRRAGGRAVVRNIPYLPISSTQVRAAAREGQDLRALVPPAVADYMTRNSLYREQL